MFSHGASWNIEFAPLFIFSPISHRCALCLPIDLITKVDFNWIAGKAHKVRTEVIKKNLGGRREDDRGGGKEGLRDGRDRLQVTRSSLEAHFKQKLSAQKAKFDQRQWFQSNWTKNRRDFPPRYIFPTSQKGHCRNGCHNNAGFVRRLHGGSCWYLQLRCVFTCLIW